MYICDCCGRLKEELGSYSVCHGYSSLGESYSERFSDDECSCGGTFVEAEQCAICGEWICADEEICKDCQETEFNLDNAIRYGKWSSDKYGKPINEFFVFALGEEKVEEILSNYIRERSEDFEEIATEYCSDDKSNFSEFINE
jgi:RecJ-like exonuclease